MSEILNSGAKIKTEYLDTVESANGKPHVSCAFYGHLIYRRILKYVRKYGILNLQIMLFFGRLHYECRFQHHHP